jgi:hypothetical protein
VNGVALCDNPGSGKTIVSLALIQSKPFVSVNDIAYDMTAMVPSKSTLIICPLHLAAQWQSEAVRCMPGASVVMIPTTQVYFKTSWDDVLLADIVIIPLTFLQNKQYLEYGNDIVQFQPGVGGLYERIKKMMESVQPAECGY